MTALYGFGQNRMGKVKEEPPEVYCEICKKWGKIHAHTILVKKHAKNGILPEGKL